MERPPKISNLMAEIRKCLDTGKYLDTRHASERQTERHITRPEVIKVLRTGFHEKRKDQFKVEYQTWNYSVRGKTVDAKNLRVIISFDPSGMLLISAIDLDN